MENRNPSCNRLPQLKGVNKTIKSSAVESAKVVTFYKDGDCNFGGLEMCISKRYWSIDTLMNDLNKKISLPNGVRAIYTPKGTQRVEKLKDFVDKAKYVCSSNCNRIKTISYSSAKTPSWGLANRTPKQMNEQCFSKHSSKVVDRSSSHCPCFKRRLDPRRSISELAPVFTLVSPWCNQERKFFYNYRSRDRHWESVAEDIKRSVNVPYNEQASIIAPDGVEIQSLSELHRLGSCVLQVQPYIYRGRHGTRKGVRSNAHVSSTSPVMEQPPALPRPPLTGNSSPEHQQKSSLLKERNSLSLLNQEKVEADIQDPQGERNSPTYQSGVREGHTEFSLEGDLIKKTEMSPSRTINKQYYKDVDTHSLQLSLESESHVTCNLDVESIRETKEMHLTERSENTENQEVFQEMNTNPPLNHDLHKSSESLLAHSTMESPDLEEERDLFNPENDSLATSLNDPAVDGIGSSVSRPDFFSRQRTDSMLTTDSSLSYSTFLALRPGDLNNKLGHMVPSTPVSSIVSMSSPQVLQMMIKKPCGSEDDVSSSINPKVETREVGAQCNFDGKNVGGEIDVVQKDMGHKMESCLEDSYDVGDKLGVGDYAVVRDAVHKSTKKQYLIKSIKKQALFLYEDIMQRELGIIRLLNHPNILKLEEEYVDDSRYHLVFEYVECDLYFLTLHHSRFDEGEARIMMRSLSHALMYLHHKRPSTPTSVKTPMSIVHRNVRLESLFICVRSDGTRTLKLGDFSMATFIRGALSVACSSIPYIAPEILNGTGYGVKIDTWATGVVCYILLSGHSPFIATEEECHSTNLTERQIVLEKIRNFPCDFNAKVWNSVSFEAKDFICHLLEKSPCRRFSACEMLEHPWLTQTDGQDINGKLDLKMFDKKTNSKFRFTMTVLDRYSKDFNRTFNQGLGKSLS